MKRVLAVVVLSVSVSGCVSSRAVVSKHRDTVPRSMVGHHCPSTISPEQLLSDEEMKIRRLEALTTTVIVVGKVAVEVLRHIR